MIQGTLELPESLDISEATLWQQTFLAKVNECDEITINDNSLVNIDTAGLQLLLVFVNEIKASQKKLVWDKPSELIQRCAQQLGIHQSIFQFEQNK